MFKLHFSYHVLSNYTRYIFIAIFWHPFAILITALFDEISPSSSLQIFVCNWTNSWKAWITGWKYKRALLMNSKTFSGGKQRLSSNTVKTWTSWPKLLKHQNKSKYWTFRFNEGFERCFDLTNSALRCHFLFFRFRISYAVNWGVWNFSENTTS